MFANYRFLAGQDSGRLFVIDAVSGKAFFETDAVPGSILYCANYTDTSFSRVYPVYGEEGAVGGIKRENFTVNANGTVERGEMFVSLNASFTTVAPVSTESDAPVNAHGFLCGSDDGRLALATEGAEAADFFLFRNQIGLLDAAALPDSTIAFTSENGYGAFIPADFNELLELDSIALFSANSSNRVSPGSGNSFLFWHYGGGAALTGLGHIFPFVKTKDGTPLPSATPEEAVNEYVIDDSGRSLRSAAISGGNVLLLDFSGGITIHSLEDGRRVFSYTSALSLDVVFAGDRSILVARNAEAGRVTAPLLLVDTVSGETLPVTYPALAAFMLYKDRTGSIYCAVLKNSGLDIKTEVIKFNAQNPETSETILQYNGEDTDFSFIAYGAAGGDGEVIETFASTVGGEDAFIGPIEKAEGYGAITGEKKAVERGPAFPQKLLPWNENFAALDGEGTVSWYDGFSGKLLAMLRFYETEWLLSTAEGKTKHGSFTQAL